MEELIQYMTMTNTISALAVLVMLFSIRKIISGDIGDNRFGYLILFVSLGAGLYLWHSGAASAFIADVQGTMENL
jgi:hypothetical protein